MLTRLVVLFCLVASFEGASVNPSHNQNASDTDFDEDNNHTSSETLRPLSSDSNARQIPNPWAQTDWTKLAKEALDRAKNVPMNDKKAKNVIFFIGDGMGISTLASARLFNAEMRNLRQKDIYLAWENMPHVALARTYNADKSTPDGAGAATAYLCGVKANYKTIGVNDKVRHKDCTAVKGNEVLSVAKESIDLGKWTGVVTTSRITDASPAGTYAHVADREWEAEVPQDVPGYEDCKDDIAMQLITDPKNMKTRVILGGGRRMFLPQSESGSRRDNRNLIKEWKDMRENANESYQYVQNWPEFHDVDASTIDYLLGLFNTSNMAYEVERIKTQEPSLSEMTEKAIQLLQRSPEGYFLFVQGGNIDEAHHLSNAYKALYDTIALSDAVQMAVNMTNNDDTLIVVSADHSHVFTFGGEASLTRSVLDLSDAKEQPLDEKPFLQLNYANGPSYPYHRRDESGKDVARKNLTEDNNITSPDFKQDTGIFMEKETHGGEDVGIFATGPMSHLCHGIQEQSYIAHLIMYASCVGAYQSELHCSPSSTTSSFKLSWKHFLPLVISVCMMTAKLPGTC